MTSWVCGAAVEEPLTRTSFDLFHQLVKNSSTPEAMNCLSDKPPNGARPKTPALETQPNERERAHADGVVKVINFDRTGCRRHRYFSVRPGSMGKIIKQEGFGILFQSSSPSIALQQDRERETSQVNNSTTNGEME